MQTMGRALVAMQTGTRKMKQSLSHTSEGERKNKGEKEGMVGIKEITLHLCLYHSSSVKLQFLL